MYLYSVTKDKQKQNNMRISNIANNKGDQTYELTIIGTENEVEEFSSFTQYLADFVEDEYNGEFSITIMGSMEFSKKEFRATVTEELKNFRKTLKK